MTSLSVPAPTSTGSFFENLGVTSVFADTSAITAPASEQNFESDGGFVSGIASITQTPLPLTTIYTPPASCSQIITWDGSNLWQYGTNQTGGDCYPPDFLSIYNSFYTPGVCPDAWTSAGKVGHSSGHDAMCCPRSYFLSANNGYACASIFSNVLSNVYSTSTASNDPIPSGVSFTTLDASGGAGTVLADVIQVQWQKKDRNVISLMSQKTATGAKTAAEPAAKTAAKATAPTPSVTSISGYKVRDSGLSIGAKVGVGVAVSIIVLALLAIAAIFSLRKRKQRAARRQDLAVEIEPKDYFHELSPQDQEPEHGKSDQQKLDQLAAQPPQEMMAQEFNELPADGPVHELGGQQMQRSSSY